MRDIGNILHHDACCDVYLKASLLQLMKDFRNVLHHDACREVHLKASLLQLMIQSSRFLP